jgi:hypothetical protein
VTPAGARVYASAIGVPWARARREHLSAPRAGTRVYRLETANVSPPNAPANAVRPTMTAVSP